MLPWVRKMCTRATSTAHGQMRLLMFDNFVAAEQICKTSGRYLSEPASAALAQHVELALQCNNWLASQTVDGFRWKLLPKHHALVHMVMDSAGTNPRATSCYLDEDFIGKCKNIYKAAHGATASRTGLLRYTMLAGIRWHRRLRTLRGLAPAAAAAGSAAAGSGGGSAPAAAAAAAAAGSAAASGSGGVPARGAKRKR
jgi:hypothetical protein